VKSSASNRRLFRLPAPPKAQEWTGERFVPSLDGEIELEHVHRYLFALQFCEARDVLDIASGEGYGSWLLAQVARSVVGVDVDKDTIKHAIEAYAGERLKYRRGKCAAIPLGAQSVDVVVSFETLEHVIEHEAFFSEIKRVLRPGGILVMSTPDLRFYRARSSHLNEFHLREITFAGFRSLCARFFKNADYGLQRSSFRSVLEPKGSKAEPAIGPTTFERVGPGAYREASKDARGVYAVCVASDQHLPAIRWGTLEDSSLYSRLLEQQACVEAERARLAGELGEHHAQIRALIASVQQGVHEIEAQKLRLGQLAEENAARTSEVARLSMELVKLRAELKIVSSQAAHRTDEISQLRESLRISEQMVAELRAQGGRLQGDLSRSLQQQDEMWQALRQSQAEVEDLTRGARDVSELQAETARLTQALESAGHANQALIRERDDLSTALAKHRDHVAHLEWALAQTQTALDAAQQRFERIQGSFIWRSSSPLRSLVDTARQLASAVAKGLF
jgi:SAM-dependent methyltransferase